MQNPRLQNLVQKASQGRTSRRSAPVIKKATQTGVSPTKAPPVDDYQAWRQRLKAGLSQVFKVTGEPDQLIGQLLADQFMSIWEAAFTHSSVNPNPNGNYEWLETLGDAYVNYVFYLEVVRRAPNLTAGLLSAYKTAYMETDFQGNLSQQMGLDKLIRSDPLVPITVKMAEDVFESFFGALGVIANQISVGLDTVLAWNLIRVLFQNVDLTQPPPQPANAQFKEIFDKLGLNIKNDVRIEQHKLMDGYSFAINLITPISDGQAVNVQPGLLSSAIASSVEKAKNSAYDSALARLRQEGVTDDWVAMMKRERIDSNQQSELYDRMLEKAQREGYQDVNFVEYIGPNHTTIQLVGLTYDNGQPVKVILGRGRVGSESKEAKDPARTQAMEDYLAKK